MNPNPGIPAVPLQAIAPTKKSAKKQEKMTNSSKYKHQYPFVPQPQKPKQCKDKPKKPKGQSNKLGPNVEKKNPTNLVHEEQAGLDFSKVPPPFCSCSGFARRCYKSGPGGWQSSCCTNSLSEYPLPSRKPGKRVTGRKMRGGPYRKLLCTLLAKEGGHDLAHDPVDLKDHWAQLGTNKFVTFK